MMFNGRVYDGPWEGRFYEDEKPYFYISGIEPISWKVFNRFEPPLNIKSQAAYRWSQPLRAWVYCWDGNPSRYAYEGYRDRVA